MSVRSTLNELKTDSARLNTLTETAALPRVVVIGCAGHARVLLDILESERRCAIVGLLDSYKPKGTRLLGYQILGTEEDLPDLVRADLCDSVVVGVGDNCIRAQIVSRLLALVPGILFVTPIHPSAQIGHGVSIGPGTVIMPGVVVNTGCRIGKSCILNTCSSLDHDSIMEDFSSLGPRAVTGGTVIIGTGTAIAIGAIISHGVSVGQHTVVGAGATVLKDIPPGVLAYGVPAKVIRKRDPEEPYLGDRSYEALARQGSTQHITKFSMQVKAIRSDSPEWNEYLGLTAHDVFHTAEYHRLMESFGGGTAWLFVCGNEHKFIGWPILARDIGTSQAGALRDISSAYGYTGPFAYRCVDDRNFLQSAWNTVCEIWKAQGFVSAFTRLHPLLGNERYIPYLRDDHTESEFDHRKSAEGATIAIDLTRSAQDTWSFYSRQLRQALRRLLCSNLVITPDPQWDHLPDFVRLYHITMARNCASGFYFFTEPYFRRLRDELGSHGSLMIGRIGDDIATAALLTEYQGIVNVHLLATDDRFLALSPSKLLIHAAGDWARQRGNRFLHLGGGRGSRTDDSLFRFKSQFSDKSYPFFTGRWVLNQELYEELKLNGQHTAGLAMRTEATECFFPAYRMRV